LQDSAAAALEAACRCLAYELGPQYTRVHAISPGQLKTRAVSRLKDFEVLRPRLGPRTGIPNIALIAFGAAIALAPLPSRAQNAPPAAPVKHHAVAHKPTGSYRSEMRRRHNSSKERARAGAEHVRTMRQQ